MKETQNKLISDDGEDEGYPGFGRKVSLNMVNKVAQSICKITLKENNNIKNIGTGFFMIVNLDEKNLNCLITNYHIISQDLVDKKESILVQIEKENKEIKILLDTNKRFIKCFKKPIDITIIEIIESDKIINNVKFLWYDCNYLLGYDQYSESDILILQHPLGEETQLGIGKILNIQEFEFEHSIETDNGSSGSPVILIENLKVIGIHKQSNKKNNNGIGTFIGQMFKEIESEKKKISIKDEKKENDTNEKCNKHVFIDKIINIKVENLKNEVKDENYEFFEKIKIIRCDEIKESNYFKIRSRFKIFNYFIYSSSIRKYGCRKKFNYSKNNS